MIQSFIVEHRTNKKQSIVINGFESGGSIIFLIASFETGEINFISDYELQFNYIYLKLK